MKVLFIINILFGHPFSVTVFDWGAPQGPCNHLCSVKQNETKDKTYEDNIEELINEDTMCPMRKQNQKAECVFLLH